MTYPVPEFDSPAVVFGAELRHYLTREQTGEEFWQFSSRNPFTSAAESIFFKGGRLSDYGLTVKEGLDEIKVVRAVQALLTSFAPQHEQKIATVGFLLSQWCEVQP